mgnify:CR=1 FL=1
MADYLGEKSRIGRVVSFFVWMFAFVGGFACFTVWALFMRNYVHADAARAVSGIIGLAPLLVVTWAWALRNLDYRYRILRSAVMWCGAVLGFFMLTAIALIHMKNWIQ